jgi:hypothetical protein
MFEKIVIILATGLLPHRRTSGHLRGTELETSSLSYKNMFCSIHEKSQNGFISQI